MEQKTHLSEIDLSTCIYPIMAKHRYYLIDRHPEKFAKEYVEANKKEQIQEKASEIQWHHYTRTLYMLSTEDAYSAAVYSLATDFLVTSLRDGTFLEIYQNNAGLIKEDIERYRVIEEKEQEQESELDRE